MWYFVYTEFIEVFSEDRPFFQWEIEMTIQEGDIVTVILQDSDYSGRQGRVIGVSDDKDEPPITVDFSRTDDRSFLTFEPKRYHVRFQESDLQKNEVWRPEVRVYQLFGRPGRMWHTLRVLKDLFGPESVCHHRDCGEKVASRCMVNIHGIVYEVDLCESHQKQFHGKNIDSFPWRKKEE